MYLKGMFGHCKIFSRKGFFIDLESTPTTTHKQYGKQ